MVKQSLLGLLFFITSCTANVSQQTRPDQQSAGIEQKSLEALFTQKDFVNIQARFSVEMQKVFPEGALRQMWEERIEKFGPIQKIKQTKQSHTAIYTCAFEKGKKAVRLTLNVKGEVDGLFYDKPLEQKAGLDQASDDTRHAFSKAEAFMQKWTQKSFTPAAAYFSPEMKEAITPSELQNTWHKLSSEQGSLSKCQLSQANSNEIFLLIYEKAEFHMHINKNVNGKIVGIFFFGLQQDPT